MIYYGETHRNGTLVAPYDSCTAGQLQITVRKEINLSRTNKTRICVLDIVTFCDRYQSLFE